MPDYARHAAPSWLSMPQLSPMHSHYHMSAVRGAQALHHACAPRSARVGPRASVLRSLPLSKFTENLLKSQAWQPPVDASGDPVLPNENFDQASAEHMHAPHACIMAGPVQYDSSTVIKQRSRDFTLVETPLQLQAMLAVLEHSTSLAIDCEGVHLGAPQGNLCLIQLATRQASHAATSSSSGSAPTGSMRGSSPQPSKPDGTKATSTAAQPSGGSSPGSTSPAAHSRSTKSPSDQSEQPPARPPKPGGKQGALTMYIVDVHQLGWKAFHYRRTPSDPTSINLKASVCGPHPSTPHHLTRLRTGPPRVRQSDQAHI